MIHSVKPGTIIYFTTSKSRTFLCSVYFSKEAIPVSPSGCAAHSALEEVLSRPGGEATQEVADDGVSTRLRIRQGETHERVARDPTSDHLHEAAAAGLNH